MIRLSVCRLQLIRVRLPLEVRSSIAEWGLVRNDVGVYRVFNYVLHIMLPHALVAEW